MFLGFPLKFWPTGKTDSGRRISKKSSMFLYLKFASTNRFASRETPFFFSIIIVIRKCKHSEVLWFPSELLTSLGKQRAVDESQQKCSIVFIENSQSHTFSPLAKLFFKSIIIVIRKSSTVMFFDFLPKSWKVLESRQRQTNLKKSRLFFIENSPKIIFASS